MDGEQLGDNPSLQTILRNLGRKLEQIKVRRDGSFDLEIVIRAKGEAKLSFSAKNRDELVELIDMNADKIVTL